MPLSYHRFLLPFILFVGIALFSGQAISASEASTDVPTALSPDSISALVSKMDAEQTDALVKLIEVLDSTVDGEQAIMETEATPMLDALKSWVENFGNIMQQRFKDLPEMFKGAALGVAGIFSGRSFSGSLMFLGLLGATLAIGYAAERLLGHLFSARQAAVRSEHTDTLLGTLKLLSTRALIQTFGILCFWIAAVIAAKFLIPDLDDRQIVTNLIVKVIVFIRISAAVLRFVLAPERTDLRLVSTDTDTARLLFRQLVTASGIIGIGFYVVSLMQRADVEGVAALRFWVGLIAVLWIMFVTWQARQGLTSIIIGDEENLTPGLKKMANWWPRVSIFLLGFVWLLIQFVVSTGSTAITEGRGTLIIALVVVLPFLDTMVRGIAGHLVPPMQGEGPVAEQAHLETRAAYVRIGRLFLLVTLVFVIAKLLGLDLKNIAESGLGTEIAAKFIGFLMIIAAGYLSTEVVNLWINRRLVKEMPTESAGDSDAGDGGGSGKTRMATILPILRMTLQVTIIMLTVLLALSQLGINIAPLLAGAGVLGLAIGFGAQTLVKDIVSGVFFLMDDAFRMGEYIDVGGTAGTVEKISIRSLQLRGPKGPVHIIPYGSMSKLTNLSRDWVIMKLQFTVPFDTDIDRVRKIFKKVGQQIMEIPEYKDDLLAPFKSQGAADVTDVGIVIKGKFMTKPGGQWMIRREIYTRVQKMFQEYGIEFARREVRVQMPDLPHDVELGPEQKQSIAAAANEAAEASAAETSSPKKTDSRE